MAYDKARLEKRNAYIRQRFSYFKKKNPKWEWKYLIEATAEDIFLSPVTVAKIITSLDASILPSPNTIIKYTRAVA